MPTFIGRELGRRWCPRLLGWGLHAVRHDKGSQRLPQAGCLHVVLRLSRLQILETQEPGYIMYFYKCFSFLSPDKWTAFPVLLDKYYIEFLRPDRIQIA